MITYKIISKQSSKSTPPEIGKREHLHPSQPDFKEKTYRRAYQLNVRLFPKGQRVKVRGSSRRGIVVRLYDDINEVIWEGNRPHYIECQLDDGTILVANPGQLKKKGS